MEKPCLNKRKWKAAKEDTQHQLLASMHVHTHDLHAHTHDLHVHVYTYTHTCTQHPNTHSAPKREN